MTKPLIAAATLAATLGISASAIAQTVGNIEIVKPWSRATATTASTGAGYLEIKNASAEPDRLIAASCDCAEFVEIHEIRKDGDIMRMRALTDGLAVPAGGAVTLKPGGYHVMFIRLKAPFEAGEQVRATLTFEHAGPVDVAFDVRASRGGMKHKGHEMKHRGQKQ